MFTITNSKCLSCERGPPHHEVGEDRNPEDADEEGDGEPFLPGRILGVWDGDPHGEHEREGHKPQYLAAPAFSRTSSVKNYYVKIEILMQKINLM